MSLLFKIKINPTTKSTKCETSYIRILTMYSAAEASLSTNMSETKCGENLSATIWPTIADYQGVKDNNLHTAL